MLTVIDSTDGGGSTLQTEMLVDRLVAAGKDVLRTNQPSDGPIGLLIRQALRHEVKIDSEAFQLLYSADRLHHCRTVIEPAIAAGKIVVCDRYDLSTAYYLTAGQPYSWKCDCSRPLDLPLTTECPACGDDPIEVIARTVNKALSWNSMATRPDISIMLAVSAETAFERRSGRGGKAELFDGNSFQARVCALYSATNIIANEFNPWRNVVTIDGEGTPEEVHEQIVGLLVSCYPELMDDV